jgi:Outer membrane protein beta-barrel domain
MLTFMKVSASRAIPSVLIAIAVLLGGTTPARAQTWPERVYISVNGAYQPTKNDFNDRFEFERNVETGSTEVSYPVRGGFVFDAGAGYRLWKNLGVGVAVSHFTHDDTASTRSSFPHPFFFNQPREVTGDATGITRNETAVHIQAMYMWNPSGPLRIVFSGGPTFFSVEQELVEEIKISESFPFDTATFSSAQTRREKATAPAFNVGADVMWLFNDNVGIGGIARFSRTSVDLDAPTNRTISVDAGGVYVGGGLRVLF